MKHQGIPALAAVAILAAGCGGGGQEFMPLEPGLTWIYHVSADPPAAAKVQIKGAARVGMTDGVQITGDLGDSRMAWRGPLLRASMLGGTLYDPPLPVLDLRGEDLIWEGIVIHEGVSWPATARLTTCDDPVGPAADPLKLRDEDLRCSRWEVTVKERTRTVTTHFARGFGIVQQTVTEDVEGSPKQTGIHLITGPNLEAGTKVETPEPPTPAGS
ncbi:MAG: hypothetical protein MH204_05785 [Fimbriimonadaceae bacterium]|nr:hypothetical protein [Fimbriimonadaceae bacterium]